MEKKRSAAFWLTLVLSACSTFLPAIGCIWYFGYAFQGFGLPLKAIIWLLIVLGYLGGCTGFFLYKWWGRLLIQISSVTVVASNIAGLLGWIYEPSMMRSLIGMFGIALNIVPLLILVLTAMPVVTKQFDMEESVFSGKGINRKIVSNMVFLVFVGVSTYLVYTEYAFEKKILHEVNSLDLESLVNSVKEEKAYSVKMIIVTNALKKLNDPNDTEKICKIIKEIETRRRQLKEEYEIAEKKTYWNDATPEDKKAVALLYNEYSIQEPIESALIDSLGSIRDKRAVAPLLELLFDDKTDWELRSRIHLALRKITGANIGQEDWFGDVDEWKKWWEENKGAINRTR